MTVLRHPWAAPTLGEAHAQLRIHLSFTAGDGDGTASVPHLRHSVAETLHACGVPEPVVHDVTLAANELLVNAIRYGEPPYGVALDLADDRVQISVHDSGAPFEWPTAYPDRPSYHGLPIIRALGGALAMDSSDGRGKSVWATFTLSD